jgi:hypothetical protein
MNTDVLESFALKNAYQSSENGNFAEAMDWLKRIPSNKRPKELERRIGAKLLIIWKWLAQKQMIIYYKNV